MKQRNPIYLVFIFTERSCSAGIYLVIVRYLEAKEELTNRVTDADALLSTGAAAQLIYDDQGPVTYVVDYIRDLWEGNMQSVIIS